ncbi:MAG: VanZ family protein [Solirubrobacterales bacterium]|jgi:VanZ family protein|nr:VanZ family protein [Solirubrobacterales bacterium]
MRSVGRVAPALALMGVIFFISAQSGLPSVESDLDVALRKLAHMTEFGVLWLLWLRALRGPRERAALVALVITLAYAVSDEVHQSFVAGRHPSAWDVAIDAAGVGVAVGIWVLRARNRRATRLLRAT